MYVKIKACNALNAMYVNTVNTVYTGVCGFYTTFVYRVMGCEKCTLCTEPLAPPGEKAHCSHQFCRFSCSPVKGGSFINFLGLVNYKGDCRQDIQPIPNS